MPSNCICECLSTRTMPMDEGRTSIPKPDMIWEEDSHSAPSRTSSTSGYRENCSLLMMPMGSSDERSSSPVHLHHHHNCLTASCSTIMPADSPGSVATAAGCSDREMSGNDDVGSQQTIVTYEHEDTLLWVIADEHFLQLRSRPRRWFYYIPNVPVCIIYKIVVDLYWLSYYSKILAKTKYSWGLQSVWLLTEEAITVRNYTMIIHFDYLEY